MAVELEPTPQRKSLLPVTLSDSLLIAVAPGFGYLLVLVYQLAFADRLGIPRDFIDVSFKDTLVASIMVALLLLNTMNMIDVSRAWFERLHPSGKRHAVRNVILLAVFAVPFILASRGMDLQIQLFLVLVGVMVVRLYLFPLWSERTVPGYWNKLDADTERRHRRQQKSILAQVSRKYQVPASALFGVLFLLFYLTFFGGAIKAAYKTEFLTLPSSHEVVLVIYDDKAIVAPLRDQEFLSSFRIVRLGDDAATQFRLERIGPLKPRPVK